MHDQELARTSTYLQTTLNDYAKKFKAYLKRIDEDHFLLLAHLQDLEAMEEDKFSVLDKIRLETSRNNTPLTLSVGIAYGGESLRKIANQAQANLDLALGRGGDQVVLQGTRPGSPLLRGQVQPNGEAHPGPGQNGFPGLGRALQGC